MSVDREAARKRCDAATPGPWEYVDNGFDGYICDAEDFQVAGGEPHEGRLECDDPNMIFIVHARTDLPAALDELDRKDEEIVRLTALTQNGQSAIDTNKRIAAEVMRLTAEVERLRVLDMIRQRHISETYYDSCMPWWDEAP